MQFCWCTASFFVDVSIIYVNLISIILIKEAGDLNIELYGYRTLF